MASPRVPAPDILAFGEAMVELNQAPEEPTRYVQGFGGDTSNFCVAAARSGATAGYVSAVGADSFGRMLRELWAREGVDDRHVRTDAAAPTGIYFVTHDASGHHFEYRRAGSAASRYRATDLPLEAIAAAKVLHLSGVSFAIGDGPAEAGLAAMAHARKNGVRVSLDTNLRLNLWPLEKARGVMTQAFALTDICLPSWDDVTALLGLEDRDAILGALLSAGVGVVALKEGPQGCTVATPQGRARVAPHEVRALDATGAGDCFGGAFVARLVAGDTPEQAARYANVAAALSTQGYGAVAPIPHAEAVRAALQASAVR
jgi:2-dehydro-3-deoxygluconokinase